MAAMRNDGIETKDAAGRPAAEPAAREPLVSVVVPTFNRAELVARAIRSIVRQTYTNLEIIVVDDASTDATESTIKQLEDSRIRYVRHETNRGGSAARNTGIRCARGDFVAFLDDDDEWEPSKTEMQLETMEGYDAVLCTSNLADRARLKHRDRTAVTLEDLRRGGFTAGGTGVLMARTAVLKRLMFDETLPRYQDWDLFIRFAREHRIRYLNEALVRYNAGAHVRITNAILRTPAVILEDQFRMVTKHRAFFGSKWFRRHMCRAMLYGLKHRGDKIAHLRHVMKRYGATSVVWALKRRLIQKMKRYFKFSSVHRDLARDSKWLILW